MLALEDVKAMEQLAKRIAAEGLSVREVEATVKRPPSDKPRPGRPSKPVDPNVQAAEATLQRSLGTKVRIAGNGNVGRVEIHYHSSDELDRLYRLILEAGKRRA